MYHFVSSACPFWKYRRDVRMYVAMYKKVSIINLGYEALSARVWLELERFFFPNVVLSNSHGFYRRQRGCAQSALIYDMVNGVYLHFAQMLEHSRRVLIYSKYISFEANLLDLRPWLLTHCLLEALPNYCFFWVVFCFFCFVCRVLKPYGERKQRFNGVCEKFSFRIEPVWELLR